MMEQREIDKKVTRWGSGGAIFAVMTSSIVSEALAGQSLTIRMIAVFIWGGGLAAAWYYIARAIIHRRAKNEGKDN